MKKKTHNPKFMRCSKIIYKETVYNNKNLPQEIRKISNK